MQHDSQVYSTLAEILMLGSFSVSSECILACSLKWNVAHVKTELTLMRPLHKVGGSLMLL